MPAALQTCSRSCRKTGFLEKGRIFLFDSFYFFFAMGRRAKGQQGNGSAAVGDDEPGQRSIATIEGWEDGEYYQRAVTKLDRWELQSADRLTFHFNTTQVVLVQDPHSNHLGGYIWLTAIVFCTYLESVLASVNKKGGKGKKRHEWIHMDHGKRWVELGSGVGLIGIMLAKLGIENVIITDIADLVDIMERNVEANGLRVRSLSGRRKNDAEQDHSVVVEPLLWNDAEAIAHIQSAGPIDYLLACDCIYSEASAVDLVLTMDALATESTSVICVSEVRNEAAQEKFMEEAKERFTVEELAPHAWQDKACSQTAFNETLKMYRMFKGKRGKRSRGTPTAAAAAVAKS
ncbi:putative methyltransferase-domain-containing protein [Zychaea mexicana]|uniref:putative methyltransferase-domain-containing protein n=1 Tax=Zychaea mexicana TaxID=64656 RepID=UPI0022FE138D|nr:putative methyltransferase-domain-containing protein [Zychaea mexicana]KAI9493266.1 putative methyltransferase-domain-containing protein [Zychaea mexicana]